MDQQQRRPHSHRSRENSGPHPATAGREQGVIAVLNDGFGFIRCEGRTDYLFFSMKELQFPPEGPILQEGLEVEFFVRADPNGRPSACQVAPLPRGTVQFIEVSHIPRTGCVDRIIAGGASSKGGRGNSAEEDARVGGLSGTIILDHLPGNVAMGNPNEPPGGFALPFYAKDFAPGIQRLHAGDHVMCYVATNRSNGTRHAARIQLGRSTPPLVAVPPSYSPHSPATPPPVSMHGLPMVQHQVAAAQMMQLQQLQAVQAAAAAAAAAQQLMRPMTPGTPTAGGGYPNRSNPSSAASTPKGPGSRHPSMGHFNQSGTNLNLQQSMQRMDSVGSNMSGFAPPPGLGPDPTQVREVGVVTTLKEKFGFIKSADNKRLFFHCTEVRGIPGLGPGMEVSFVASEDPRGGESQIATMIQGPLQPGTVEAAARLKSAGPPVACRVVAVPTGDRQGEEGVLLYYAPPSSSSSTQQPAAHKGGKKKGAAAAATGAEEAPQPTEGEGERVVETALFGAGVVPPGLDVRIGAVVYAAIARPPPPGHHHHRGNNASNNNEGDAANAQPRRALTMQAPPAATSAGEGAPPVPPREYGQVALVKQNFGFLQSLERVGDLFFHQNQLQGGLTLQDLAAGTEVEFTAVHDPVSNTRKLLALSVCLAPKGSAQFFSLEPSPRLGIVTDKATQGSCTNPKGLSGVIEYIGAEGDVKTSGLPYSSNEETKADVPTLPSTSAAAPTQNSNKKGGNNNAHPQAEAAVRPGDYVAFTVRRNLREETRARKLAEEREKKGAGAGGREDSATSKLMQYLGKSCVKVTPRWFTGFVAESNRSTGKVEIVGTDAREVVALRSVRALASQTPLGLETPPASEDTNTTAAAFYVRVPFHQSDVDGAVTLYPGDQVSVLIREDLMFTGVMGWPVKARRLVRLKEGEAAREAQASGGAGLGGVAGGLRSALKVDDKGAIRVAKGPDGTTGFAFGRGKPPSMPQFDATRIKRAAPGAGPSSLGVSPSPGRMGKSIPKDLHNKFGTSPGAGSMSATPHRSARASPSPTPQKSASKKKERAGDKEKTPHGAPIPLHPGPPSGSTASASILSSSPQPGSSKGLGVKGHAGGRKLSPGAHEFKPSGSSPGPAGEAAGASSYSTTSVSVDEPNAP